MKTRHIARRLRPYRVTSLSYTDAVLSALRGPAVKTPSTVLYAELVADAADLAATDPTLSPVGSAAPTIVPHLSVLPHLEMIGGVS